jgi:hypothetical protein
MKTSENIKERRPVYEEREQCIVIEVNVVKRDGCKRVNGETLV